MYFDIEQPSIVLCLFVCKDELVLDKDAIADLVRRYHDDCERELKSQTSTSNPLEADNSTRKSRQETSRYD